MFEYDFMLNAFAAGTVVAVVAGLVGYVLVLRGQAFAGHALGHLGFSGATGAALLGWPPLPGLVAMTVLGGISMGLLGERAGERDVAIGVVLSASLGLGLLFLHFYTGQAASAAALLFGNLLGVEAGAIWGLLALGVAALLALSAMLRPLLFATLQPELAEARGVPMRPVSVAFLAVAALAVSLCAQVVGVLLVFTLLVAPAAAAQRLARGVGAGMALSAALAVGAAWGGLALSYWTDWPPSVGITALSTGIFAMAALSLSLRERAGVREGGKNRTWTP
jgi:zinc/manganese transport system permease protein